MGLCGNTKTKDFYRLLQKHPFKKMFVIISDALRYEIGQEIVDNIKTDSVLKGGTTINYAISPLPSETRFGMANLLPHKTIEYADKAVLLMESQQIAFQRVMLFYKINANLMPQFLIAI